MSCRKDVESAILNNVFDKHVKGRYTYDRISEDTIQINGLSDNPSSKAMTSTQAKIIADSLLKKIYNSTNGYVTGYTERFSNYDPYKIRLRVNPRYIDHVYTNLPTEDQTDNNEYLSPDINSNEVRYMLRSVNILTSDKAIEWFKKADKHQWRGELFYSRFSTDLQIPKKQVDLIKSLSVSNLYNREQMLTDLAANYSYTIEINTATTKLSDAVYKGEIDLQALDYEGVNPEDRLQTSYYSNLTVPGGTNYTENEIATPAITPSIKGHARFSTDNGIGWFRSDEQEIRNTDAVVIKTDNNEDFFDSLKQFQLSFEPNFITTKTRRILEVQSDWGQKQRKSSESHINVKYDIQQIINDLQKSGDLKIDCN